VAGAKGHNINDYYITGKPRRIHPILAGWPGSFKSEMNMAAQKDLLAAKDLDELKEMFKKWRRVPINQ
jgi:hypothetical protein